MYPSFYEGFGLPILEAMNMSCPVACSKTSSFLEIGGKAVVYFDPNSAESIKDILEETIFDDQKINEIKIKGLENIKSFSWKDCANKTDDKNAESAHSVISIAMKSVILHQGKRHGEPPH